MVQKTQKSKKSLLAAWLLTAVMLLQLVSPLSVLAAETAKSGKDKGIKWELDSNGVLTLSGIVAMRAYENNPAPWIGLNFTEVVIEEGITTIGDYAFYECANLTSVTLPYSITSIGKGAFYGCSGLTSITLPNSITSIEDWAFTRCDSLTSIILPDSVTSIGEGIFYRCENLNEITLPSELKSIPDFAFRDCFALKNIELPNGLISIGQRAFCDCRGLTSMTIPISLKTVAQEAFAFPGNWFLSPNSSVLSTVYYKGTANEWSKINVEEGNDILLNAEIICSYIDEESKAPISNNSNMIFNDKSVATNTTLIVICVTISLLAVVGIAILVFIKVKKSK